MGVFEDETFDDLDYFLVPAKKVASGGPGNNVLNGTPASDTLLGLGGNDTLRGKAGNDVLKGGADRDTLIGGLGVDRLVGGAGGDKFVFQKLLDSGVGAGLRDVIVGFSQAAGDKINLSRIDADLNVGGIQDFVFIGKDSFASLDGFGKIRFSHAGNNTIVQIDLQGDGDLRTDLEIQIKGRVNLTEDDFIL